MTNAEVDALPEWPNMETLPWKNTGSKRETYIVTRTGDKFHRASVTILPEELARNPSHDAQFKLVKFKLESAQCALADHVTRYLAENKK